MNRLTSNLRLMMQRPPRQQYAALCYRRTKKGQFEVLVATSRDTGRWVIPKGWPMKAKKPHQVAEQEAYEEVGVKGKVEKEALGVFHYRKTLADGLRVPVQVQVHVLEVQECVKNFPEKGSRRIEWVSCDEAAERVREPELKTLLLQFGERLSERRVPSPIKAAS